MASSGNFCVWNAVTKNSYGTLSQGNLKLLGSSGSGGQRALSSFGLTSGKWYMEFRAIDAGNNYPRIGLSLGSAFDSANFSGDGYQAVFLFEAGSQNNGSNCKNANDSTGRGKFGTVSYTNTGVSGGSNVFGFALDLDNRKLFISKDGTYFNSGDPANGTNPQIAWTTTPSESIHLWGDAYQSATQIIANWGQDSTFSGNETAGGNTDQNGFGDFKHSVPAGFLAICSANLPISDDIDPAQTDDDFPQKQFNAVLYTGNGSSNAISGLGLKPDLVWGKSRSASQSHRLYDSSRGGSSMLNSDTTNSAQTGSTFMTSFDSDGFTYSSSGSNANDSGVTYVAWCWRAGGGVTSSNTDGSITSTVQSSTSGGFSICTYTGNGTNGATFGHGLSAKPSFVIIKNRDASQKWAVWHQSMEQNDNKLLFLNESSGLTTEGTQRWDVSAISNSVFGLGSHPEINGSGADYVAYIWHDVEGMQRFGKFTGNGNDDGPFIYLGFRPRLVAIKWVTGVNSAEDWGVFDTARSTSNPSSNDSTSQLHWNRSIAGVNTSAHKIDFLSNGFKLRGSGGLNNTSGATYIYMCWADVPFKYNNTF